MSNEDEDYQEAKKLTMKSSTIIKRILKYLKPHMGLFIFAIALYAVQAAISSVEPMLLGMLLNTADEVSNIVTGNQAIIDANYMNIVYLGLAYASFVIGGSLVYYFASMAIQKVSQEIIVDMRQDVFKHIQSLSINQLHSIPVGKWVTRATNDVNSIMSFFSDVLVSLLSNFINIICVTVMVFILNWEMALIIMAFVPVIIAVSFAFAYFSRKYHRLLRSNISSMNAFLSENLSGMETIQEFNQEDRKKEEFTTINKKLKKSNYKAITVFAIFRPSIYFIYTATILTVFVVGLNLVREGSLLIGFLYSFYNYVDRFFYPIQNLANTFNTIQSALSGAERVLIVLDTKSEIEDSPDALPIERLKGKIEFKHVWFAYKKDEWILKDVSFKVEPGETIAFVGETGAGKSTIINLMVRNFDIQKGQILIDDIDIKSITLDSLRQNIGEMLQDVFLFSGTIKSNISLGDDSISDEEIKKACEYVGASSFIEKLPKQYDEPVLENGNNFSSGQRQLISFARVVTYKPSLVVLDEATANIDTETEVIIQSSLEKIKSIGTMVMVAHRLSTIKHASMIYVVDHGEIVEKGNHQALLKLRGIYYNLYKLQSTEKQLATN